MVHDDEKQALDTRRLEVYLTSLQAEVEAKIRRVHRFRENMREIDAARSGRRNIHDRSRAARALIEQIDQMMATNLILCDMFKDLRTAAETVLADVSEP